ncbi:MAG: hypothetical protein ACR2FG_13145 [Marmoricola sp.]
MDDYLMLHGSARWCRDCGSDTIHLPVPERGQARAAEVTAWCCTSCDAAVVLWLPGTFAA